MAGCDKIIITFDNVPMSVPPDGIRWERTVRRKDGNGAPIYNPYHRVFIASGVVTGVYHASLFGLMDRQQHVAELPHPSTGELESFTCYVDLVTGAMSVKDKIAAMTGFDMELSRITVTY